MAQGYLRSMGMGEWTPKASAPPDTAKSKQATTSPVHTTKQAETGVTPKSRNNGVDDDDQDFDFWLCDVIPSVASFLLYALDSFTA